VTESDWAEQLAEAERAGAAWLLLSPIHATGLEAEPYLADVEVAHRLRSDTVGDPVAAPVVRAVTGILRADGAPLGSGSVTLDLESLAVDAVIQATRARPPLVYVAREGGGYSAGIGERWEVTAGVIRSAVGTYRRFRWTPERTRFLLAHPERNASEIGEALGIPPVRVRAKRSELRKRDDVPLGKGGRPRKGNT
jgi:hypothetical protein